MKKTTEARIYQEQHTSNQITQCSDPFITGGGPCPAVEVKTLIIYIWDYHIRRFAHDVVIMISFNA